MLSGRGLSLWHTLVHFLLRAKMHKSRLLTHLHSSLHQTPYHTIVTFYPAKCWTHFHGTALTALHFIIVQVHACKVRVRCGTSWLTNLTNAFLPWMRPSGFPAAWSCALKFVQKNDFLIWVKRSIFIPSGIWSQEMTVAMNEGPDVLRGENALFPHPSANFLSNLWTFLLKILKSPSM